MLGFVGTVAPASRAPASRSRIFGVAHHHRIQLADAAPLPESRNSPSEDSARTVKHFAFEVKNPAVLAELKAKGVKMAFDLRVTPTEDFAFISDNAGNAIELIEHKTR